MTLRNCTYLTIDIYFKNDEMKKKIKLHFINFIIKLHHSAISSNTETKNKRRKMQPEFDWQCCEQNWICTFAEKNLQVSPFHPGLLRGVMLQALLKEADENSAESVKLFPNIYACFEFQGEITHLRVRKWINIFNNNAILTQRETIQETAASILKSMQSVRISPQRIKANSCWIKRK